MTIMAYLKVSLRKKDCLKKDEKVGYNSIDIYFLKIYGNDLRNTINSNDYQVIKI